MLFATRGAAVDVGNLMQTIVAKSIYLLIKYSCLDFSSYGSSQFTQYLLQYIRNFKHHGLDFIW